MNALVPQLFCSDSGSEMLASQTFRQLGRGPQYSSSRRQLVARNAVSTSLRVPCQIDLEQLGRAEGQDFPLNTHGVGKAGGVQFCMIQHIIGAYE